MAKKEYFNDLSNNLSNNNNRLLGKTVSFIKDVNNKELSKKEDSVTRTKGVLL